VRALRLSLLPATIALGLYAEWAALRRGPLEAAASGSEIRIAAADLVVGLVLVGGGLLAQTRRPESRTGLLLALAGLAWFLGTFADSGNAAYADFGALFVTIHRGPLVHALLSYPDGRLESWAERGAVAGAYAVSAIADAGVAPEVAIILAVAVLVVGAQRFLRAVGPQRRARLPAAVGSAALAAVLLVSGIARIAGSSAPLDRGVLWAYQVVIAGIAIGLTLDLVLGRWVKATVTGLVVDLGETGARGALCDRLANALGDRSLVLGYWLTDRGVYVDDRGREVELPEEDDERRVTTVRSEGEPVAVLIHDAAVVADPELVGSVASAARIAVVNARLQAEIVRQVEELEVSRRRLLEARDGERLRLERELHEGAEQRLVKVEALLDEAARGADYRLATLLTETHVKLNSTRSELREFARGIHPRALTNGLPFALRELAGQAAVPVALQVGNARYPSAVEAAAYFVCSEALANVGKHSEALGATMEVTQRDRTVVVVVSDDGKGGASLETESGLRGLADRVEALGGRLTVTSPLGAGTRLVANIPLP
jgi:signal transduction histidine kinase